MKMGGEKSRSKLELKLLGSPEVRLNGQPVTGFRSGKTQALLYYLAVTGRAQPRSLLAGMFWGDVADSHARRNLTTTLSNLRQLVGHHLNISRENVAFKLDSEYWLDVGVFEARIGATPVVTTIEELKQTVALYRGDFLEGFYIHDAPEFEQWVLVERVRLREQMLQALHTLANHLGGQGDLPQAIEAIRRVLTLEPWREEAHRYLMLLLVRDGQRSAALVQFETCRQMLAEELDVEPDQETVTLYQRIRNGDFSRGAEEQGSKGDSVNLVPPLPGPAALPPPHLAAFQQAPPAHNLPPQPTPFVGREKELADIIRRLTDKDCRILTLVGPGGIGKTRLALQVIQTFIDSHLDQDFFGHGVLFVPLAAVDSINGMVSAIAKAANFTFYGNVPPKQQLLDYFQEREMLIVLDNLEYLLFPSQGGVSRETSATEGMIESMVEFVAEILATAPNVKILTTSREALSLREAWFHPVEGMSFPPLPHPSLLKAQGNGGEGLEQYDAVQLFVQCAARAKVQFSLAAEQAAVIRICRLVEGMPLAIEMAAAWLKILSAADIAAEIERGFDILTVRHQNVPERHRSMRVVMEQSWQLLREPEREVFKCLSIFRGGFAPDAARVVAGASLMDLAAFVDKSLLQVTPTGRYQMHELLRQYAAEQLAGSPQEMVDAYDKHCAYYVGFLQQQSEGLLGGGQRHAVAAIATEYDNVWAAWHWAVKEGKVAEIEKSVMPLQLFCQFQSRYLEGANAWEKAFHHLSNIEPTEQVKLTLAQMLVCWGWLLIRMGQLDKAESMVEQSRDLYRQLGIPTVPGYGTTPATALSLIATIRGDYATAVLYGEQARQESESHNQTENLYFAYYVLASAALNQGDYATARRQAQQAYTLGQGRNDRWFIAYCLNLLGDSALALGDLVAAQQHFEASYALRKEFNDPEGMAVALNHLGEVALQQKDYRGAQQLFQQSYTIYRDINDKGGLATSLNGLGKTACALGEYQAAQQRLHWALEIAAGIRFLPLTFSILISISDLLLQTGPQERSLELLALIRHHPASDQEMKAWAQQHLSVYEAELPPDLFSGAILRGQNSGLEAIVATLQVELARVKGDTIPGEQADAIASPIDPRTLQPDQPLIEPLTPRELEVLRLIANGLSNPEIAEELIVAVGTIKALTHSIYGKLGTTNRVQAVSRARELNLL